ncbi:MAG: DUF2244 domain-containing protein [Thioalkalispiraceae bacterium]|jgi:uncharacterized membrane protein
MIDAVLNKETAAGHIVLSPNLSARWKATKQFMFIVSSFALVIAASFAAIGLWMILPFAGMEVLALLVLMYRVSKKCYQKEVIRLNKESITVEQGQHFPRFRWHSDLFWTRLIVQSSEHPWHSDKLILRGRRDQIEIGAFLNEQEKHDLVRQLRSYVSVA